MGEMLERAKQFCADRGDGCDISEFLSDLSPEERERYWEEAGREVVEAMRGVCENVERAMKVWNERVRQAPEVLNEIVGDAGSADRKHSGR